MSDKSKKGLALLILEKAKKAERPKETSDDNDDDDKEEANGGDEGLTSAMEDFISAVHSKDAEEAVKAFKNLFELCE